MLSVEPLSKLKFDFEVEESARKLWKLLVTKVGARKAKRIMLRVMGDKNPGPKPEEHLLNSVIRGCVYKNARRVR